MSNLFIRSLAVTDLELSTVVLPFSITYQILGHWVFWQLLCELWLVMDMIECLSSISHLTSHIFGSLSATTISPDHDQEQESDYLFMLIDACDHICVPNSVFPNRSVPQQNDNFLNATNTSFSTPNPLVPSDNMDLPLCLIGKNPLGYRIASLIIFFWAPSILMASIYIKIYITARKHIKQMRKAKCARQPTEPSSGAAIDDQNNMTVTECVSIEDEDKVNTISVPEINDTSIRGESSAVYTRASTSNPQTQRPRKNQRDPKA